MYRMFNVTAFLTIISIIIFSACGSEETAPSPSTIFSQSNLDLSKPLASDPAATSIVQVKMDAPLVQIKAGIWTGQTDKSSMWSTSVQLQSSVNEFYVAPNGVSTNSGTKESPWDLATALWGTPSGKVPDNSIIWLTEGDYIHADSSLQEIQEFQVWLAGTAGRPIHVRPEFRARVRIDGGLYMTAASRYLRIWDLEMTTIGEDWRPKPSYFIPGDTTTNSYALLHSWTGEQNKPVRLNIDVLGGDDIKIINTVMDKTFQGIGFWKSVSNGELYGSIMYDNGWIDDGRPHGPGIYMQNSSGTTRIVHDNIVAGNLSTGMQIRSGADKTNDFDIQGNVWFAPNTLAKGRNYVHVAEYPSTNIVFKNNFVHAMEVRMPYVYSNTEYQGKKTDHECNNNHFYRTYTNGAYTCNDDVGGNEDIKDVDATLTKAYLRPNKYDPRRANLIIINGGRLSDLSINLGTFVENGDKVIISNALDPFGEPIASGIYNGSYFNIHWPDSAWTIQPQSNIKDLTSINKEFWTFIIMKVP